MSAETIARRVGQASAGGLDYQSIGSRVYSVADQFELLTVALNDVLAGRAVPFPLKPRGLMGPDAPSLPSVVTNLNLLSFRDSLRGVEAFVQREGRVPARVFVGADVGRVPNPRM